MIEAAKRPIDPIPWVNWFLMDVLMAALSNDPAARPTAATFRDQLAHVPVAQMAKRGLLVGVADDTSYVPPPIRSCGLGAFANLEQPQCCRYVGSNRIAASP